MDFSRLPRDVASLVLRWVLPVPRTPEEALVVRPRVPAVALTCRAFREASRPVVAAALWCLVCSDDTDHAQIGALPIDQFLAITDHLPHGMGTSHPVDRLRTLIDLAITPWQNTRPPNALDWVLQETPVRCESPLGVPVEARALALQITVEHACAEDRDIGVRDIDSFELLEICLHHLGSLLDTTSARGAPVALQQALLEIALLLPYGNGPDDWAITMDHNVLFDWPAVHRLGAQAGIGSAVIERLPALAKFIRVADLHDPQTHLSHPAAQGHIDSALLCLGALPVPYTPGAAEALAFLNHCALSPEQQVLLGVCNARDPRCSNAV